VLSVLRETGWHVPTALRLLEERGVGVDRSYVYEIKRAEVAETQLAVADVDTARPLARFDQPSLAPGEDAAG
jgi:hypothetical protein